MIRQKNHDDQQQLSDPDLPSDHSDQCLVAEVNMLLITLLDHDVATRKKKMIYGDILNWNKIFCLMKMTCFHLQSCDQS